ncbi:alpha/beta hydrolase [Streptomyces decoyicus]
MVERIDVRIPLPDGIELAAWLFLPENTEKPLPAITMAHGFGGTRHHSIEHTARRFSEAGYAVLLHDHRNFGDSGGTPRQDIDPYQQIADWRWAITYLGTRWEIDEQRICIWGFSYAGGHALVLGATDRRIKSVYAQAPTVSGYETGLRRVPPHEVRALEERFHHDERDQLAGKPPVYVPFIDTDTSPGSPAAYPQKGAADFYLHRAPEDTWTNEVTLQSNRRARAYEPGQWISRIAPTPLLMLVAKDDDVAPADIALDGFNRAREPKKLVLTDGDHFLSYIQQFELSCTVAIDWFDTHLRTAEKNDSRPDQEARFAASSLGTDTWVPPIRSLT